MNWMNPDNVVHAALNKIGDVIIANLLFLLCSVPLITIGPALSALYQEEFSDKNTYVFLKHA